MFFIICEANDRLSNVAKDNFVDGLRQKHTRAERRHWTPRKQNSGHKQCEKFSHMENCWSNYLWIQIERNGRCLPFALWLSVKDMQTGARGWPKLMIGILYVCWSILMKLWHNVCVYRVYLVFALHSLEIVKSS